MRALAERGIDATRTVTEDGEPRGCAPRSARDLIALADDWTKEGEKFAANRI